MNELSVENLPPPPSNSGSSVLLLAAWPRPRVVERAPLPPPPRCDHPAATGAYRISCCLRALLLSRRWWFQRQPSGLHTG